MFRNFAKSARALSSSSSLNAKDVNFGSTARESMMNGIDTLANSVAVTIGWGFNLF